MWLWCDAFAEKLTTQVVILYSTKTTFTIANAADLQAYFILIKNASALVVQSARDA